MDIYQRKSRIKFLIIIAAILIAVASLWYTGQLAKKIADEEKSKVILWAQALEKKANLVNRLQKYRNACKNRYYKLS